MSLEKSIQYGKDKRKPFYGSSRFDATCRPNGGCAYCRNNRMHKYKKRERSCKDQVDDIYFMDEIDHLIDLYWEQ